MEKATAKHIPLSDEEDCQAIESEALALRADLSRANRDLTRELLGRLRTLSSRLPICGRRARRSAGIIQTAITHAQQQLQMLCDEEDRRTSNANAQLVLELCVYAAMSEPAKRFYNTIEVKKTYAIAPVTEGGVVSVGAKKEVQGEELRREFSLIKYYSMSEEEKKDVLNKALYIEHSEELVSNNPLFLAREREDIAALHRSLRHMEAYKAFKRLAKVRGNMAVTMLDISYDHDDFARAHKEVDVLMAAYDRVIAQPHLEAAVTQLKQARAMVKHTLDEDILHRILLGDDHANAAKAMALTLATDSPHSLISQAIPYLRDITVAHSTD